MIVVLAEKPVSPATSPPFWEPIKRKTAILKGTAIR
jgi:hypothetical protein